MTAKFFFVAIAFVAAFAAAAAQAMWKEVAVKNENEWKPDAADNNWWINVEKVVDVGESHVNPSKKVHAISMKGRKLLKDFKLGAEEPVILEIPVIPEKPDMLEPGSGIFDGVECSLGEYDYCYYALCECVPDGSSEDYCAPIRTSPGSSSDITE